MVARTVGKAWVLTQIDSAVSSSPVVWSENPAEYADVSGSKKINATHPVIVWCAYEAWAIVYGWVGSKVSEVQVSD